MKYNVYMESGNGARYLLASFDDYEEALNFCEAHLYHYTDDNGFVWDLDLVEISK